MAPDGSGPDREDDLEAGEPVAELRDLVVEPTEGFTTRVRRRIERREASNELFRAAWHLPTAVFLVFLEMVFALFGSDNGKSGDVK